MPERLPRRVILTGFAGSGKSTVARQLASRLGWAWCDTDALIEEREGCTIAEIFAREGEPRFREIEASVLERALQPEDMVVATGGGAMLLATNRRAIASAGFVVCLQTSPAQVQSRTRAGAHRPVRPLLAHADDAGRLLDERAAVYARADWTVHTDALSSREVVQEIMRALERYGARTMSLPERVAWFAAEPAGGAPVFADSRDAACVVRAAGGVYPVYVEWGGLGRLGEFMARAGLSGTAHVIGDERVLGLHRETISAALERGRLSPAFHAFPPGEASKSLGTALTLYERLVEARAERTDPIVAVGGGVAGDLGGFVAATYLRGVPLVQVPTSLLGMVDASIGGKVGVNLREGKNLVGAIYQPRLVVADTSFLATLSPRELASGWGEVIKHAFIFDEGLLELLAGRADDLLALEPGVTTDVVARNVALKGRVAGRDERESGLRMILNYGHTIAHGIEAATAYGRYLHGEAVALGMTAAVRISHWLGLVDEDVVRRQDALVRRYGLPLAAGDVDPGAVRAAMQVDKKVRGGGIRWVLLEGIGRPVVRADVPEELVARALAEVLR